MTRLFVAVRPAAHVVERLDAIDRPASPGVRWVPVDQWHVTLRFLGEADAGAVTARLVTAALASSSATFGPVVELLGRDAVVVPVGGLDDLAAAVVSATADLGRPPELRPFRGHLTVARVRPGAVCPAIGAPLVASMDVDRIELVSSELHPAGAVHEVVATFHLQRPALQRD